MPQSGPGSTAAAAAVGGRALPSLNVAVTESSQHLVAVNTRKAALRRKKSKKRLLRERRRRIIFIVLVAVVTALAVALLCVCVVWPPKKIAEPEEVCRTKECLASAYRIVKAMDSNTNPCEDFYTFACGNWVHEHPLYGDELEASRFTEARHSLALEIQDILEANNSPSDPLPVKQARELYNSCMAIDHLESLSVKPMIDTLEMLGLPGKLPDEDSVRNFNLTRTMALIQYHLTIDKIIFSLGVGLDPHNETRRLLLVTPPRISMKRQNAKREKQETEEDQGEENGKKSEETREEEEREDEEMEFIVGPGPQYYATKEERPLKELVRREILYRARMMQLFELERGGSEEVNITKFHVAAIKTLLLELKLYQEISSKPTSSDVQPSTLQRDAVTALETNNLTETSNMIDWELFLNIMFEDVDGADHSKDRILVLDRSYFKKIALLLAKTKTETIQRLIWWKVIDYLAILSTKTLRSLRFSKAGVSYGSIPRSKECLRQIHDLMPAAVSYKIATSYRFPVIKKRVEEMLMDIRAAFESLVKEAKWMDDKTRKEALLKVEAMGHMIGFPQNLLKHGYLEDLYSELKVEKGMFLKSVVNIHTVNANKALKSLTSPQQRRHNISSELPDPFVVNAYNVITHNFIVIPSGILRVPLYGLGLEALNYGAIGFVLAHELTHSFDNKGRTFDKEGEQKNWWTQNTTIEFNKRADCFKKQYGSYKVQDRHINGRATLGENIADNGGLRESIRAYRNYVNRNGKEQKLPGLEHLSHEQLLYLSFANVWCQSTTKQADILLLQDVHSPAKYRVIGTLSNMEDFSEAWSCPAGSNMNPKEKCVLW